MDMKPQIEGVPVVKAAIALAILSVAVIKADQDVIKTSLTKLDMQIHSNAVQCLLHAEKHGDTSLMRRLLVDIIEEQSGYRRRGLINWMRKYSPMELKGDTINLSGVDAGGIKRPFLVADANASPFWTDKDNAEKVAVPVFQAGLLSPIESALKKTRAAIANTVDGKAIDPTKPFYDGVNTADVLSFADAVEKLAVNLKPDNTMEVRKAQKNLEAALAVA